MRKIFTLLLLTALFALVACDNPNVNPQNSNPAKNESEISESDRAINNLMGQCKVYDAEALVQGLPGEWLLDSYLAYDNDWKTITSPFYVMGDMNCEGLNAGTYTFTAEGKGVFSNTLEDPLADPIRWEFEWNYNAESGKLLLSGENYNTEYKVSGFNNEYLVLDYYDSVNKLNTRKIYKRIVE